MKQPILISAVMASLMGLPAAAASSPGTVNPDISPKPFQYMPKVTPESNSAGAGSPSRLLKSETGDRKVSVTRTSEFNLRRLPSADASGYVYSPTGEIWYYTLDYDKETVDMGAYTQTNINGFTATIYDAAFKELGSVSDKIELSGTETRVVDVQVSAQVTKKFFNYDDKYEIMMGIACNTSEFVNNYRTVVYTLGNDEPVITIPGYYCSAINTATDKWSEKFWITFLTEEEPEETEVGGVMNTVDYVFRTYKAAGYSGMGDPVLTNRVPGITVGGESAVPFLATQKDGIPYFAVNHLKYSWFLNPYDWENETPTPDNELIVDIYSLPSSWASAPEKYSTTTIPSDATESNRTFLYLGAFSYYDDISVGGYSEDGLSLIITKALWTNASDEYVYDYDVYDVPAKGEDGPAAWRLNIAKEVTGGFFMNDIPGYDPQVMFIIPEDSEYSFRFVNLLTGELEHELPYRVADGLYLTTQTERVADGDSYLYAAAQTRGEGDGEGNTYTKVAYITPDGAVDHVDALNLGQNVDYAQIYIASDAFNPYTFNLDDEREYMALVKRRTPGETGNHEELMVISADSSKEPLLCLTPDEELGALHNIYFSNLDTDNAGLVLLYYNGTAYTTVAYELPLTLFDGEGTLENPYLITTAGGLGMIKSYPDAHYVIANDIDASGYTLRQQNSFTFTGTLDGQGHVVKGLTLSGYALVPTMLRNEPSDENVAVVRNINFVSPTFTAAESRQGLVAGSMTGGRIENVHIYGGNISGNDDVAGIAGGAYLYATIAGCSVNADINGGDGSAAGIVVGTRTSSTVKACAFTGSIEGGTAVGGIVGTMSNAADRIADCHVDADIKGKNTIGGIAATSDRGLIDKCHVEGTITATEAARWGGGVKTGGIVGELSQWYAASEDEERPSEPVITGCIVNLKSMTGPEDKGQERFEGQNDSMHRIVGFTSINNEPEEIGYDEETWEPIYGDPQPAEANLAKNYAVSTLSIISDKVEDGDTTTEGESIDASEITHDFLAALGFAYGDEIDAPWSQTGTPSRPALFFEGGLLMFTPSAVSIDEGQTCSLTLALAGMEITEDMFDSFTCDLSDESVLEMSGMEAVDGSVVLTFKGLAEGVATVTAGINGKTAQAVVTVNKYVGVADVSADKDRIAYDGRVARAGGCVLRIYGTDGSLLLTGNGAVDLTPLASGVYIVTATDSDGVRTSLKVRR